MTISEKNRSKIVDLRKELDSIGLAENKSSSYSDLELDSFLQFQKSVLSAAKALLAARRWKEENPVCISDVASFYRSPEGLSVPPGCLVCLEDGKGGVARDHEGRPIIWMMGIIYGSKEELKQQTVYALERASHYRLPHHRPDEVCFVVEIMSRDPNPFRFGLCSSFRFPDAAVRSLFDFMKSNFPGSQFSQLHFCGLPSFITSSFNMVKPFVSKEMFDRLLLRPNFKHLRRDGYVQPDSILPEWDTDGTFHFDMDDYVEWRAKEEGVPLSQLPPRGSARAYVTQKGADIGLTTEALLGNPEARENVIKMGWVDKRGSGVGLFASHRWKSKFMVLTPGCLFYFETSKVSESNAASRMISIDSASSSVEWLPSTHEGNDKKAMLCLQSAGRDYIFGFTSREEAKEWLQVLDCQCQNDDGEVSYTESSSTDTPESMMMINPASVSTLYVGSY